MGPRTWPEDWERRREGEGCVMCAEGRPDVDDNGNRRFFTGRVVDGYLHRHAPARGYSIVVWRGRHVSDVSEMTAQELTDYWLEVAEVARALTQVFEPCQLNYQLLGNAVPHVHTHIVPRYVDDACPNAPLQWAVREVGDAAEVASRLADAAHTAGVGRARPACTRARRVPGRCARSDRTARRRRYIACSRRHVAWERHPYPRGIHEALRHRPSRP